MEESPPIEQGQTVKRIDGWLPAPGLPRPVRWALAMIVWPVMGVMMALGAVLGIASGLMFAFLGLGLVILVLYLLGAGGVEGFVGVWRHPLSFVPHDWITAVGVLVGLPLLVVWIREVQENRRSEDDLQNAKSALTSRLYRERGEWPSDWELEQEHADELPSLRERSRLRVAGELTRDVVACAAAAVVVYRLVFAFSQGAANAPWAAVVLVLVVAGASYLVFTYVEKQVKGERRSPVAVPLIGLLMALAFATALGIENRSGGMLRDYCDYGAVSRAEVQGCLDHVTDAQIQRLNTDAARFAQGNLDTCLGDAGPYCANRAASRQAAENYDPQP